MALLRYIVSVISMFVDQCVSQQTYCTPKISTLFYAARHVEERERGKRRVRKRVKEKRGRLSNL